MREYKVIEDTSMKGGNNPDALERKINDTVSQGWNFAHVTSFATTHVSKVYLFFEREKEL